MFTPLALAPIEAERTAQQKVCTVRKPPVPDLQRIAGYAEWNKRRVVVAPHHYYPILINLLLPYRIHIPYSSLYYPLFYNPITE